jgi:hypothetical protein
MSLIPSSSIVLIRGNHEPFNRLALNESIHDLGDVGDGNAPAVADEKVRKRQRIRMRGIAKSLAHFVSFHDIADATAAAYSD